MPAHLNEMPALIVIVGPSGVGKTSLLRALESRRLFATALEDHSARPFQSLFKQDPRYALPNQLDYLLLRAAQERQLRSASLPALMDGGLDLDFHGFTRLFHARGWLSEDEFDLCRRFYQFARSLLPLPDRVIALHADPHAIHSRLAQRDRINIASASDAKLLETFIREWLASLDPAHILHLDVSAEPPDYSNASQVILDWLQVSLWREAAS